MRRSRSGRPARSLLLLAIPLTLLLPGPSRAQVPEPPTDEECAALLPEDELERLLALDADAFDQTMDGGWRPIAGAGCFVQAAELIDEYVRMRPGLDRDDNPDRIIFRFHAGQLYATAGRTDVALDRFRESYQAEELIASLEEDPDDADAAVGLRAWNAYVDATIAFLEQDRPALEAARARVARGPEFNGEPMNLSVVDRFLEHFGSSYAAAYSGRGEG